MQKKLDASAGLFAVVGMKAELSIRVNAAIAYLLGAARFSRMVGKIERDNASSPFGDFWEEMRDLATACVFFVDAAVESYANEIFADRAKLFSDSAKDLDRRWDKLERRNTITKLNLALKLRHKRPLDRNNKLCKELYALNHLRNELVHFKPEWSHEYKKHMETSELLEGLFTRSSWFQEQPIFPQAWVSHSCTTWAVNTTAAFIREFERLADFDDRSDYWESFKDRLQP